MMIRKENRNDAAAIRHVVAAAFGQALEADLVDALRESGDAVISLVAEDACEIVGHVLISKFKRPTDVLRLRPYL